MKLIVAIVQAQDAHNLVRALTAQGHRSTRINTAGGFLREGNATILVGVDDGQVDDVIEGIRQHCHARQHYVAPPPPLMDSFSIQLPVEVTVGGATVFVLDVERFERV